MAIRTIAAPDGDAKNIVLQGWLWQEQGSALGYIVLSLKPEIVSLCMFVSIPLTNICVFALSISHDVCL